MATYRIHELGGLTPGTIAAAGHGDMVHVYPSATRRHDWAGMSQAVMTAYARGAAVFLTDRNPRDAPSVAAGVSESDKQQVSGGAS